MTKHKLIITAALMVALTGAATASPADVSIFPDQSSTEINSFTSYEVEVENTGPVADVYELSSTSSEVRIAPERVPQTGQLEPGETATAQLWYNPGPQKDAGVFSFSVTAESRASGEQYTTEGTVEVIKDHQVDVQVAESRTGCLDEVTTYDVQVTNEGIQSETFRLTPRAGSLNQENLTLAPGETQNVTLEISSSEAGTQNFNVVAASTTSYAQDIESVEYVTEICYDSDVNFNTQNQEAPAYTETEFDVTVRNTGTRDDEFVLSSNIGTFEESTLEIDGKSSETTTLTVRPTDLGSQSIQVTAESTVTRRGSATLNVVNGMSSEVSFEEDSTTVCENEEFAVDAEISNNGAAEETFTLSTNQGAREASEVILDAGDSEDVEVSLDSSNYEPGTYKINLTSTAATFGNPVQQGSTQFTVENCYDVQMSVNPEIASSGENRSVIYQIDLTNPGTEENTYEVSSDGPDWISVRPQEVTVAPGETEQSYIYAGVPFGKQTGDVRITARAQGDNVEANQTVRLVIGQELEEAIESPEQNGPSGGFAPQLPTAEVVQSNAGRIAASILVGLLVTAAVLYHEW